MLSDLTMLIIDSISGIGYLKISALKHLSFVPIFVPFPYAFTNRCC